MKLNDILSSFNGGHFSSEDALTAEFAKLAKKLLYGGHFRVMNSKDIYLEEIEFYYHEEGDGKNKIKDPIMYHTNDHDGKTLPYFKLGRFNLHTSGVDVTFENKKEAYRASFLIRAYSIDKGDIEHRSTYIYDDMLYMGIPIGEPIEIEWIEDEIDKNIENLQLEGTWRINVPEYEKNESGEYEKDEKGKYIKREALESHCKEDTFVYSKIRYVKCHRPWRFVKQH